MAIGQYAGLVGGVIGAIVGGVLGAVGTYGFGAPAGAAWGFTIGSTLGSVAGQVFWPEQADKPPSQPPPQPHETRLQLSSWGMPIPIQYGDGRMAGNIIYMSDIVETIETVTSKDDNYRYHEYTKTYTATFAIAFCEGPVPGISRIWMNRKVIADWRDPAGDYYPIGDIGLFAANLDTSIARAETFFSVYLGSEDQTADTTIAALITDAETPAYKGLCYIVFKDFPIGEFSGVPQIEIEIGTAFGSRWCSGTFTDVNMAVPNTACWTVITDNCYIYDNKLKLITDATNLNPTIRSAFGINGDFDFQVDYSSANTVFGSFGIRIIEDLGSGNSNTWNFRGRYSDFYISWSYYGGSSGYHQEFIDPQTYGKMRISRVRRDVPNESTVDMTFGGAVGRDRPRRRRAGRAGHRPGRPQPRVAALAFAACDAEKDRPSVVFAYTVKGWRLPTAGHPRNHSALLTEKQIGEFRAGLGLSPATEWDRFDGSTAAGILCSQRREALHREPRTPAAPVAVPASTGTTSTKPVSTQEVFGRTLVSLSRDEALAPYLVMSAPDVATSTNLAGFINRVGVFAPADRRSWHDDPVLRWSEGPTGQHIELGISEMNLFLLLGQLGLSWDLSGQALLPVGTVYDPFVCRGLDAFIYSVYSGARFVVAGTPSGVTLASEGGAHQSTVTPSLGLELPGMTLLEPATPPRPTGCSATPWAGSPTRRWGAASTSG